MDDATVETDALRVALVKPDEDERSGVEFAEEEGVRRTPDLEMEEEEVPVAGEDGARVKRGEAGAGEWEGEAGGGAREEEREGEEGKGYEVGSEGVGG